MTTQPPATMTRHIALITTVVLLAAALSAGVVLLWQPRWLVTLLAKRSSDVLYFVDTTKPIVALTIDDGPDPETTPEILRVLATHRARATFFLISSRVVGNETVVEQIVAQGHELGNHLTEDEPSIRLPAGAFERALLDAHHVLSQFGPVRWLRPGGGRYNEAMLAIIRAHDYRPALGSVYPYDAEIPFPGFAARHVLRNVGPGAIIVLHDGGRRGERTLTILRRVLPELRRRGLQVVSLSELAGVGSRE